MSHAPYRERFRHRRQMSDRTLGFFQATLTVIGALVVVVIWVAK